LRIRKKLPLTPINRRIADADRDLRIAEWKRKAKAASKVGKARNLYVITLHPDILTRREFRAANPNYIEGMPCVYVGLTIHDPGDRYEQHKSGYRSSRYPRQFGVELALELIDGFDETGLTDEEKEPALADWLRDQGYAVWQN
jgi:predicted GIY-YIG superfamily endonuclease